MKFQKIIFASILIFSVAPLFSQSVAESILSLRKSYNPLFSDKASFLGLDFIRTYNVSSSDSTYYFMVSVNQVQTEQQGYSVGTRIFGSGIFGNPGLAISGVYTKKATGGTVVLNQKDFLEFYECANDVYTFIVFKQLHKTTNLNTVTTCSVGNMTFGAEYFPNVTSPSDNLKFYFKVGDEATFTMNKVEFEEIVKTILGAKNLWGK
jgi:hypothetical protein